MILKAQFDPLQLVTPDNDEDESFAIETQIFH